MKVLDDFLDIPDPLVRLMERKKHNRKMRSFMLEQKELQQRNRIRNELDMMRSYMHHSTIPRSRRDEIAGVVRQLEHVLHGN